MFISNVQYLTSEHLDSQKNTSFLNEDLKNPSYLHIEPNVANVWWSSPNDKKDMDLSSVKPDLDNSNLSSHPQISTQTKESHADKTRFSILKSGLSFLKSIKNILPSKKTGKILGTLAVLQSVPQVNSQLILDNGVNATFMNTNGVPINIYKNGSQYNIYCFGNCMETDSVQCLSEQMFCTQVSYTQGKDLTNKLDIVLINNPSQILSASTSLIPNPSGAKGISIVINGKQILNVFQQNVTINQIPNSLSINVNDDQVNNGQSFTAKYNGTILMYNGSTVQLTGNKASIPTLPTVGSLNSIFSVDNANRITKYSQVINPNSPYIISNSNTNLQGTNIQKTEIAMETPQCFQGSSCESTLLESTAQASLNTLSISFAQNITCDSFNSLSGQNITTPTNVVPVQYNYKFFVVNKNLLASIGTINSLGGGNTDIPEIKLSMISSNSGNIDQSYYDINNFIQNNSILNGNNSYAFNFPIICTVVQDTQVNQDGCLNIFNNLTNGLYNYSSMYNSSTGTSFAEYYINPNTKLATTVFGENLDASGDGKVLASSKALFEYFYTMLAVAATIMLLASTEEATVILEMTDWYKGTCRANKLKWQQLVASTRMSQPETFTGIANGILLGLMFASPRLEQNIGILVVNTWDAVTVLTHLAILHKTGKKHTINHTKHISKYKSKVAHIELENNKKDRKIKNVEEQDQFGLDTDNHLMSNEQNSARLVASAGQTVPASGTETLNSSFHFLKTNSNSLQFNNKQLQSKLEKLGQSEDIQVAQNLNTNQDAQINNDISKSIKDTEENIKQSFNYNNNVMNDISKSIKDTEENIKQSFNYNNNVMKILSESKTKDPDNITDLRTEQIQTANSFFQCDRLESINTKSTQELGDDNNNIVDAMTARCIYHIFLTHKNEIQIEQLSQDVGENFEKADHHGPNIERDQDKNSNLMNKRQQLFSEINISGQLVEGYVLNKIAKKGNKLNRFQQYIFGQTNDFSAKDIEDIKKTGKESRKKLIELYNKLNTTEKSISQDDQSTLSHEKLNFLVTEALIQKEKQYCDFVNHYGTALKENIVTLTGLLDNTRNQNNPLLNTMKSLITKIAVSNIIDSNDKHDEVQNVIIPKDLLLEDEKIQWSRNVDVRQIEALRKRLNDLLYSLQITMKETTHERSQNEFLNIEEKKSPNNNVDSSQFIDAEEEKSTKIIHNSQQLHAISIQKKKPQYPQLPSISQKANLKNNVFNQLKLSEDSQQDEEIKEQEKIDIKPIKSTNNSQLHSENSKINSNQHDTLDTLDEKKQELLKVIKNIYQIASENLFTKEIITDMMYLLLLQKIENSEKYSTGVAHYESIPLLVKGMTVGANFIIPVMKMYDVINPLVFTVHIN